MTDPEKLADGETKASPARGVPAQAAPGAGPRLHLREDDLRPTPSAERTQVPAARAVPRSTEVEDFLNLLAKSKLFEEAQIALARTLADTAESAKALAAELISKQWLTAWQAERLLSGQSTFHLGKYLLRQKLGEGGMGAVYEARQGVTDRIVAVKVISPAIAKNPNLVARFHREVQAAVALNHPNIVTAFDADSAGNNHFLVMEYVRGQDLSEWLATHGKLPLVWACECIRQACEGLDHAHQRGLVHRDLKPSNLLVIGRSLEEAPVIKILDMGLARFEVEGETKDLTHTGQVLGTPQFISPEQAKNTKNADIRSDIYSLGCTLFKMLTGENVFAGDTVTEQLAARFEGPARSLREAAPDLPKEIVEIVDTALQKYPEDRFQTPCEMAQALEGFLATQPPLAGAASGSLSGSLGGHAGRARSTIIPSDSPTLRAARPATADGPRRNKLWITLGALAVAALVVAAVVQFVLKTPRGTILVEVSQPDANITVEDAAGGKVRLTSPKLAKAITIEIPEGKNILKVDKEGFQGYVEEFTITHEGQKIFQVKLEPLAARPVVPDVKPPVKPVDPPVKTVDPQKDPGTKKAGAAPFSKLVKKIPAVRNRPVFGVALSPDHKLVACASAAEQLVLYDFATGDEVARLEGHKGAVSAVVFSSDGRTLYSAGDDHVIRIWDVERREPKGTLDGHTARITDLMFLPDGQTLASASHDKTVRLWKDGKQVKSFDDSQRLMNLDISSDGKLLATIALEGDLSLWNLETGDLKFRIKAHEMGQGVAISPLGDQVATSSSRAKVATVWDVKSHQAVFHIPQQNDAVSVLAFAPDGLLYVGSNMVRAWNVKQNQSSEGLSNDDPVLVNSIQFSSDKKVLLTGDVRGKVRIYSTE